MTHRDQRRRYSDPPTMPKTRERDCLVGICISGKSITDESGLTAIQELQYKTDQVSH